MPAMRNTFTMIIWRARAGTPREAAYPCVCTMYADESLCPD